MIKATELRIGNLVKYFESVTLIDIVHLKNLLESSENFKPIPLTEEWLLKFGFEDRSGTLKNEMSYGIEIGKMEIAWYRQDNKTRFQTIENGFILKYVTYVHELQNLYFALTNEELKSKT